MHSMHKGIYCIPEVETNKFCPTNQYPMKHFIKTSQSYTEGWGGVQKFFLYCALEYS